MRDGGESVLPIAAIAAPDVKRAEPGETPDLCWLPVSDLVVDRSYQREFAERSITLIRKIVREFDWARVRPAVVIARSDGRFEVIDGQHLATAAATHGGIADIPCLVVPDRETAGKAAAFVGLNRDRVAMTPLQVFKAELEMGDETATAVAEGVAARGSPRRLRPAGAAVCAGRALGLAGGGASRQGARAV